MKILYMLLLCIVVNVDRRSNTQPANTAGFRGDQLVMAKEKDACQDNARIDEFVQRDEVDRGSLEQRVTTTTHEYLSK